MVQELSHFKWTGCQFISGSFEVELGERWCYQRRREIYQVRESPQNTSSSASTIMQLFILGMRYSRTQLHFIHLPGGCRTSAFPVHLQHQLQGPWCCGGGHCLLKRFFDSSTIRLDKRVVLVSDSWSTHFLPAYVPLPFKQRCACSASQQTDLLSIIKPAFVK